MKFITAFRKEWLELARTKRTLIALVVLVLFGLTSTLLAKMVPQIMTLVPGGEQFSGLIPEPTINDAVAQYVKNITQFGILLALLFGMGSMANEKDKGTAAMVLSKPMPRFAFLAAKLTAYGVLFLISILVAGAACYYYTYILFGKLNVLEFLEMNGLILLYLMVYLALTVLFSTLTKTQYIAIGAGFGMLILFGIVSAIPGWGIYTPDLLVTNAGLIGTGQTPESWIGLWVSIGIITLAIAAAGFAFQRQEI
jgi:ABC-2 type transport system permease protein